MHDHIKRIHSSKNILGGSTQNDDDLNTSPNDGFDQNSMKGGTKKIFGLFFGFTSNCHSILFNIIFLLKYTIDLEFILSLVCGYFEFNIEVF